MNEGEEDCHWDDIDDSILSTIELDQFAGGSQLKRKGNSFDDGKLTNKKTSNGQCNEAHTKATPLQKYRRGYLWVSDMSAQSWCEQQMVYGFTLPTILVENPVMAAGTDLHLAREKEVQDTVQIKVTCDEDIFAVKVVNLYSAVRSLHEGVPTRREIPIFGAPFGQDVFVIGLVDEIKCDMKSFSFDILELKTRQTNALPSKAQRKTHDLQVMLYKKLFDDLVLGNLTKETISKHLCLDLEKKFGKDVSTHADDLPSSPSNLNTLLDLLFTLLQATPIISQIFMEYCFQKDNSTIAIQSVDYDETWLKGQFITHVDYWIGRREPYGVDIEDAWKCSRCDFNEVCEWRKEKAQECQRKNKLK